MHRPGAPPLVPLFGVAAVGLLLGHWLAYIVVVPQVDLRDSMLSQTGHSYLMAAAKVAVLLAMCGLGAVFMRAFGGADLSSRLARFSWVARRVLALQLAGFATMEIVERIAAHEPVSLLFEHGLFFVGMALQLVLALVGAAGLACLGRAVARATPRGAPLLSPPANFLTVSAVATIAPACRFARAVAIRGPPHAFE